MLKALESHAKSARHREQPAETSTLKQTNIVDVNAKQLAAKTERMVN